MTLTTSNTKTIEFAYEEFIRIKKIGNVADRTVKHYDECYKIFRDYISADCPCEEISQEVVLYYIEHLRNTRAGLSDISINTYLRAIRTFLYFCMEQGYTPRFNISMIKAEKQIKETYTDEELERLLKKPNIKKSSFSEYRNWILICYLLGTGNRRSTVCNVKIGDLDFGTNELKLKKVKNKRPYIIPLSPFLSKVLSEYLVYRKGTADDYLFCNAVGQRLTEEGLKTCIQKYNRSRGVLRTGIHMFRHTFAKKWIMNRGDAFRLKAILGHSTMDMVNEYVNIFGKDLQKDFDTFNPLDNMECIKKSNGHIKLA